MESSTIQTWQDIANFMSTRITKKELLNIKTWEDLLKNQKIKSKTKETANEEEQF